MADKEQYCLGRERKEKKRATERERQGLCTGWEITMRLEIVCAWRPREKGDGCVSFTAI